LHVKEKLTFAFQLVTN